MNDVVLENQQGKSYDEEKCLVCGEKVSFYGNEYKKPCNYCGTWVFEKRKHKPKQGERKEISCWVCLDKGIIEYPVQRDMGMHKYVARCFCPKGLSWPPTVPMLDQCQYAPRPEFIELQNRKLFKKQEINAKGWG